MARIMNLPVKIRNGEGIGGARVVGWLPVVRSKHFLQDSGLISQPKQIADSQEDKARPSWVNFKQVVWHESFYKLLETIEALSVTGCSVMCGDGIERLIHPLILILSADYEEQ